MPEQPHRVYSFAGFSVSSEIELPGLDPAATGVDADIQLSCASLHRSDVAWVVDRSTPSWREAEQPGFWWLDVAPLATIRVAQSGRSVVCCLYPGADTEMVSDLVTDFVLPVCVDLLGPLVVHATAVDHGGVALAFTGPTGAGKSTLAAATTVRGASLIADDALVIVEHPGGSWVRPTARAVRVHRSVADAVLAGAVLGPGVLSTGKHRVELRPPSTSAPAEVRLGSLVMLRAASCPPTIRRMVPSEAVNTLLGNVFHRGANSEATTSLLDRVIRLVSTVPAFELSCEHDFAQLQGVAAMAISTLES